MRNDNERLNTESAVDLVELIQIVKRHWAVIFLCALVGAAIAGVYGVISTPVYEAKAYVQAPRGDDVVSLNYGRGGNSGLQTISTKDAYEAYVRNLQSQSLRRDFYRDVYLKNLSLDLQGGSQDDLYARFNQVVLQPVELKDPANRYQITVISTDPQRAANWVVRYANMAGERAKSELIGDVLADANMKARSLKQTIASSRQEAEKEREDRIAYLNEALKIAESLGLNRPPIISAGKSTEVSADMDGALVYMRGTQALRAEIENLRERKSDDPFIQGLRKNQELVSFYESIQIDPSMVQAYRQDGALEVPDRPVKPRKLILLVLGVLVGGLFGVAVVLFRSFPMARAANSRARD